MQITTGTDCNVHYCLASLKKINKKKPFVWDIVRLGESVSRPPPLSDSIPACHKDLSNSHRNSWRKKNTCLKKVLNHFPFLFFPHLFTYLCSSSRQNRNLIHEAHVCIDLCTVHQKNSVSLNVQTKFLLFQ